MSTELILLIGLVLTIGVVLWSISRWKNFWKTHVMAEIILGGGSASINVPGKLVGNMLEIPENKKFGIEHGKLYPFIADNEVPDEKKKVKVRKATESDTSIYVDSKKRTAIYPTTYPPGLPAWASITIRKCVVDEDCWEMRTRKGTDPMMNPELLVLYEHEKTMGMMVVLSQTIQEYETKLQKALTRSANPLIIYALLGIVAIGIGYLLFQINPLVEEMQANNTYLQEIVTKIGAFFD